MTKGSPVRHRDLSNPEYVAYRRFLADADSWSADAVADWEWRELRRVLEMAWRTPGYRRLYREAGVAGPDDIRNREDFANLPRVDKETIRDRRDDFSLPVAGRRLVATGGSTGIPFGFYYDPKVFSRTLAARAHQYARRGWREGDKQFILRGVSGGSGEEKIDSPDHMAFEADLCELRASAAYLTPSDVDRYVERAWEYRPDWLRVYPSAGVLFARLLRDLGKSFPPLKGILSSAENLHPHQKALMEEVFGARVFSHYGHMELAALAGMCEKGDDYHVLPFYGYVELAVPGGEANELVDSPGCAAEIVATSFIMNATLFVRYRTRDFAVFKGKDCPLCGRPYQLWNAVEGRLQEFAVTAGGRLVSMTSLNMYDDVFDGIKQFQFRQRERGRMEFAYVPKPGRRLAAEVVNMRRRIMDKFDGDMEVVCLPVEDIPLTTRGKHRFLIQELALDESILADCPAGNRGNVI